MLEGVRLNDGLGLVAEGEDVTDDEIKAMAHKAGEGETGKRNFSADVSWLLAFARMVEAAERERCAKLCEQWDATHPARLAAEIRRA